jgi:hypothetical protein
MKYLGIGVIVVGVFFLCAKYYDFGYRFMGLSQQIVWYGGWGCIAVGLLLMVMSEKGQGA